MNNQQPSTSLNAVRRFILGRVKVHHDDIIREFGIAAQDDIFQLYATDVVGISNGGMVYMKF